MTDQDTQAIVERLEFVWIVYQNNGYEGNSEPEAAFERESLADIYKAGAGDYRTLRIKKLPIYRALAQGGEP